MGNLTIWLTPLWIVSLGVTAAALLMLILWAALWLVSRRTAQAAMRLERESILQWVSYLGGSQWPKGDEDAMYRIGAGWHTHAEKISGQIPDLSRVRYNTLTSLQGETAEAADKQFTLLFDGDASVDKLAEAMAALGDLVESTGKSIEYKYAMTAIMDRQNA